MTGKEIQTLISDNMTTGTHQIEWQTNEDIATGIYFYSIKAGDFNQTRKLVLMK